MKNNLIQNVKIYDVYIFVPQESINISDVKMLVYDFLCNDIYDNKGYLISNYRKNEIVPDIYTSLINKLMEEEKNIIIIREITKIVSIIGYK